MNLETIPGLLDRAARDSDAGLRFLDRRETATWHSWAEVRERARRVAGGIRAAGVSRGGRVAIVYPTGIDFISALFGTILAGAVPVPLYPPVRLGRIDEYVESTARMISQADAGLVLVHPRVRRMFGSVLERSRPRYGASDVAALDGPPASANGVRGEDLALVQFSSGSTGDPKPVALSHGAVIAQARLLNGFWPDRDGVRHTGVSWLPLYHDMGLIGCVFPALERPSTLTLIGPEVFVARPAIWLRTLSRVRGTISPAPNFGFALALARIRDDEMDGVDLSCWRVAPNGAEPIVPDVLRGFEQRFSRWGLRPETVTPVYGLSEAALAVTFSDVGSRFRTRTFDRDLLAAEQRAVPADRGLELVSVGRSVPGFAIRIVDERRRPVGPGDVGTILVRGPSIMSGYLGREDDTAETVRDGWLDTGDLGFVDGSGDLFVTGRVKDVVIIRGRNHDPAVFERVAGTVPGTRAGRVVAAGVRPETSDGEQLWLVVETRRGGPVAERTELAERCRSAVLDATGVRPDRVEVVAPGSIPRTSSGKNRRGEAIRRLLAGTLQPPGVGARVRVASELIRSAIPRRRPRGPSAPAPDGD